MGGKERWKLLNLFFQFFFFLLQRLVIVVCPADNFKHIVQPERGVRRHVIGVRKIADKLDRLVQYITVGVDLYKWS